MDAFCGRTHHIAPTFDTDGCFLEIGYFFNASKTNDYIFTGGVILRFVSKISIERFYKGLIEGVNQSFFGCSRSRLVFKQEVSENQPFCG